jgi:hypothetical protein
MQITVVQSGLYVTAIATIQHYTGTIIGIQHIHQWHIYALNLAYAYGYCYAYIHIHTQMRYSHS